jgi:RimJ/RimL family protein N-acetyltransferase
LLRGDKIVLVAEIPSRAREWRNDGRIWKWCRQNTLISESAHQRWLERIQTDASIKMFGIRAIEDGDTAVGVCGLTSIDKQNQNAEFSLYIAPEHHGKGYGKDALRTLLEHGFKDQNLWRIWGETYDGNPAFKMFLSLGMKHEGTSRQAYFRSGKFIDCHRVAILREEWNGPVFVSTTSGVHVGTLINSPGFVTYGAGTGDISNPQMDEL